MADGVIHRCTKECPYNKKCFVCKTESEVSGSVVVLHKCMVTKEDIPIQIGKEEMPVFYDGQDSKVNNRTSL